MSDLRKAADALIRHWEAGEYKSCTGYMAGHVADLKEAFLQALAHEALDEMVAENQRLGFYDDGPAVKTYCGGKPNYCIPVDAVNMSQDRVDETAKSEHEEKNRG